VPLPAALPLHVEPLTVTHRGAVLRATRTAPEPGGSWPTVLLNHGFSSVRTGPGRVFVTLARLLASRGVAAVALDRLGHGESDGDFADITLSDELLQVAGAVDALAARPDVAALHLLGHSLGGVESAIVAAETEVPVASLTLWAPAGVIAEEIREEGLVLGVPVAEVRAQGYFDKDGQRLGLGFLDDAAGTAVYERAAGYRGPVTVVHGDADETVPVSYGRRYADLFGDRASLTVLPGGDHNFATVPLREQLLTATVDGILAAL
jgi:pimeloyl-ACP methyl ester carboxylesterase